MKCPVFVAHEMSAMNWIYPPSAWERTMRIQEVILYRRREAKNLQRQTTFEDFPPENRERTPDRDSTPNAQDLNLFNKGYGAVYLLKKVPVINMI